MLKIACVEVGNYLGRGEEYVRKLQAAVAKNMTRPYQFVCLTDTPKDGVDCIMVPPQLKGWLAKIYLFEALKDDEVLYIDLDTFVMSSLEPLLDALQNTGMAVLQNFYHEHCGASGVMYWNGDHSYIWKEYAALGCPQIETDEEWIIPRLPGSVAMIQLRLPGRVLSFKGHCNALPAPPETILVCFHGKPRPHEVGGWVSEAWNGSVQAEDKTLHDLLVITTTNTKIEQIQENIRSALTRPGEMLGVRPERSEELAICASGPSLARYLPLISPDAHVLALNGAYKYLMEQKRPPEYFAMLDARAVNTNFVEWTHTNTEHLIGLQCDPAVYTALEARWALVTKFALASPSCLKMVQEHDPKIIAFGGGATIGLTALALAGALGYRKITVYGYESSFEGNNRRVWNQPQNAGEILIDVWVEDRKYITTPALAAQVRDFRGFLALVTDVFPGYELNLMSEGLLRDYLATGQGAQDARA